MHLSILADRSLLTVLRPRSTTNLLQHTRYAPVGVGGYTTGVGSYPTAVMVETVAVAITIPPEETAHKEGPKITEIDEADTTKTGSPELVSQL